jgi:hypothetical protein
MDTTTNKIKRENERATATLDTIKGMINRWELNRERSTYVLGRVEAYLEHALEVDVLTMQHEDMQEQIRGLQYELQRLEEVQTQRVERIGELRDTMQRMEDQNHN